MEELFTHWALWAAGPVPNDLTLWGKQLWWWERMGTLVQVLAILGLAFELAGEDRLRRAGRGLRASGLFRRALIFGPFVPPDEHQGFARLAFPVVMTGFGLIAATGAAILWMLFFEEGRQALLRLGLAAGNPDAWGLLFDLPIWVAVLIVLAGGFVALRFTLISATTLTLGVLDVLAGVLSNDRGRVWLNSGILLATLVNLHFTLLLQ